MVMIYVKSNNRINIIFPIPKQVLIRFLTSLDIIHCKYLNGKDMYYSFNKNTLFIKNHKDTELVDLEYQVYDDELILNKCLPNNVSWYNTNKSFFCYDKSYYYLNKFHENNIDKVVLFKKSIIKRQLFLIINNKIVSHSLDENQYLQELTIFLGYFSLEFSYCMNCSVYIVNKSKSLGLSTYGTVFIHEVLLSNKHLCFYKYILHELIHQLIGIEIIIRDIFLLETLTEAVLLTYLEKRFSEKVYHMILNYYQDFEKDNIDLGNMDIDNKNMFKAGVLTWKMLIDKDAKRFPLLIE